MDTKELVKAAEDLTTKLLKLASIEAGVTAKLIEGEEKAVSISIDAQEHAGLLIGAHGATLNAIQVFLGIALRRLNGDWVRVTLDIGDWREKQERELMNLAQAAASRARATGEDQKLYNLTPSQRRVIHMHLSEDTSIETVSEGEGEERYLVIRRKSADLSETS